VNLLSYDVAVIDGVGDSVLATVPVGRYPYAACWNPTRNVVYIANSNSNDVSVIDAVTDSVVATIVSGNAPMGFVYNPDLNKLYEADYGSGTVTVIDGLADTVLTTIPGGSSPIRLCYNPTDSKVYVGDEDVQLMIIDCAADTLLNAGSGYDPYGVDVAYNARNDCVYTIYYDAFLVIDGATNEVISIQEFGGNYAQAICIADSGRRAFSTADAIDMVGVLDCEKDTLLSVVGTRTQPSALCLNPAAHKVYCADSAANVVTVVNDQTNAITAVMSVGQCPVALLYDSDGNKVYCAGAGNYYVPATLTVVDGAGDSVLRTLKTADVYESVRQALCLNSTNSRLYMTMSDPEGSKVIVLDAVADTAITRVPTGSDGDPDALCYNPTFNYVYVATRGCVGVIDCEHNVLIAVDTVGYGPAAFCYVPVGARVFVASSGDSTVSVISGDRPKVVAKIDAGKQPKALCWDSKDNKVFCASRGDSSLAVIDASSYAVIARIAVGNEPGALSFDSLNDYVYCACQGSNKVYVIDAHRNTVVTQISVGAEPTALAWNPLELRTNVLNSGSSSISVLRDSLHPGVSERGVGALARRQVIPTIIRGVLVLPSSQPTVNSSLLSVDGREVLELHSGSNDVRSLAPGVYFVREAPQAASRKPQAVRKIVVAR
jgi:YVTN family beta-propeller protein